MENLINKAFNGHVLSNKEICYILEEKNIEYLIKKADETKKNYFGNTVKAEGILQITNICGQNCLYCEKRKDNQNIQRYLFSEDNIVDIVKEFAKKGIKRFILQSGETSSVSVPKLSESIRRLKIYNIDTIPSIGERNITELEMLHDAGAEQINISLKTTNYTLFEKLHPEMSLTGRLACLRFLKKNCIKTGTKLLMGFPNQTNSSIADDILYLKKINVDYIKFMPFIPNTGTPLKDENKVSFEKLLKVIAITRLLIPTADLSIGENLNTLFTDGILKALEAGINTLSIELTDDNGSPYNFDFKNIKEKFNIKTDN